MNTATFSSHPLAQLMLRVALCNFAVCSLLLYPAHGQTPQKTPAGVDTAIAHMKLGNGTGRDVVVISDAGAVQAIPTLEEQFKRATDVDTKVGIASGLVKLGERDNTYWNYLLEQAKLAVDSDVPDCVYSESLGKLTVLGPELQAWADSHNVSVNTSAQYARSDFPSRVLQLALTGDPRGIPLLQRALLARNYLIVVYAAKGLAQIQDKQSIPLIIAAANRAPAGYNSVIAESLVYFDDAQAQSAVDTYMPKDKATMDRGEKARGRGVFGW